MLRERDMPDSYCTGRLGLPDSHLDEQETDSAGLTQVRREHAHLLERCAYGFGLLPDRLLVTARINHDAT